MHWFKGWRRCWGRMEFLDVWEQLKAEPIFLDQANPAAVDRAQVENYYLPLARHVAALAEARTRFLVGIAGPPGSGKSTLAGLLAAVTGILSNQKVIVIGMDGWHYPNEFLDAQVVEHQGKLIRLRQIKGAPETFDFEGFLGCVRAVREGQEFLFPRYDRRLHGPQPGAGRVTRNDRILIFEGNYLLLDEAPWDGLRGLFDLTIFIQIEADRLESALQERHQRGGRAAEEARLHIQNVDMPNTRRITAGFSGADVVVHKRDAYRITAVEPGPGSAAS